VLISDTDAMPANLLITILITVHIKHASAHIGAFSMQIESWILTCKVLDPMPAISAYLAIF